MANSQLPVKITDGTHQAEITADGAIKVDGSAQIQPVSISGTLPISGSVQSEQQGEWSVSISDTVHVDDGGGTITVDGTVSTSQTGTWNLTNISGTVSLPTGAATSAKQPAIGIAGTPSVDVLTVQGITTGTAIKTDGSATTQPVSGAVSISGAVPITDNSGSLTVDNAGTFAVQAAQSGSWTVAVSNSVLHVDDNAGSLTVDGTVAATQSGTWTVSLPTGASTAAKQPSLGTAGTASTDVLSVQGIAGMTAIKPASRSIIRPLASGDNVEHPCSSIVPASVVLG